MMRRQIIAVSTAMLISCLVESASFAPIPIHHLKQSTVGFSHGFHSHRPLRHRQQSRIHPASRNHESVNTRTSVMRHASVIEPVIASTSLLQRILSHGVTTFMSNWKAYSIIPFVAGFVGWFTNYLAVQMIFFPIKWRGVPFYRVEGEPLGFFGWQGIVPAKTLKMSEAMVNTTINDLLTMEEIIQRLDPDTVADILLPSSGKIVQPFIDELLADKPTTLRSFASSYATDADGWVQQKLAHKFLRDLTKDVQNNIGSICNLRNCVVEMMMSDRSLLGKLFQISGKDELQFLTDSGLWFGFLLGMIQLVVALYWDNPWTLSMGGLVVGLATNWLALKWIFEPVSPLKIGPIVLQGLFLRRQNEVSADFAKFFASRGEQCDYLIDAMRCHRPFCELVSHHTPRAHHMFILVLTSRQLWSSMLTDATTLPEWEKLLANRFAIFTKDATFGAVDLQLKSRKLQAASAKTCATLFNYLSDLHGYVDEALEIEQTLRARMMAMTSAQFERVLHPIFEEDELTLILAGGGLGFLAGLIQQLVSTGSIILPRFSFGDQTKLISTLGSIIGLYAVSLALKPRKSLVLFMKRLIDRTRSLKKNTKRLGRYLRGQKPSSI
jgi:uncharacterized membrane protein YheB (UPF0754 family)|eukprot:scaffold524_cov183-Alexandrium_tamarense.AAC.14